MKNSRRVVGVMAAVAGLSSAAAMLTVGCSGDDTVVADGGPDGTADAIPDVNLDAQPDLYVFDASDAGVDSDANPFLVFRSEVATSECTRLQTCCNSTDAGTFDYNTCIQLVGSAGWRGSNTDLTTEVLARGNVALNNTAAQSCLAGLATLSCPILGSSESNTVTDNCYGAVTGTLSVGAGCILSMECQSTEYCKFAGVDGGKTDSGIALGQCVPFVAQGQPCGQAPPYGAPTYTSDECAYRAWHSPAEFCDYDSYPDAGGYHCQGLRNNGAACYFDNECASGMCGAANEDCVSNSCTCLTSRDYTPVCAQLAIKDAGPG